MNDMPAARHAPTPRQRPHGTPGGPSLRGGRLALYVGALCATIPAFYLALTPGLQAAAAVLYALSALCLLALQWRRPRQWLDTWLVVGLLACVILPASAHVGWALGVRALSALAVFAQLVRLVQQLLVRTGLAGLVFLAGGVLFLCGAGFYWLEPTVRTLSDGLWLAFTTAAWRAVELARETKLLALAVAGALLVQAALGIATLLLVVPVGLAIAHQVVAALTLCLATALAWRARRT